MKKISLFLFTLFVFLNFIACKDTNTTIEENSPTNTISIEDNINKVDEIEKSEEMTITETISEEKSDEDEANNDESKEQISLNDNDKPSKTFACLGVDDKLITDNRAGLFVAGSLPLVDLYDSSITSKVDFLKNGEYFDVILKYYKNGDKLIAQYECPKAIKGTSFTDYFNGNEYRKECIIEERNNKYVSSDDCKPHLYCRDSNVKLKIFEKFLTENTKNNKVIKTFEITDSNPCQNARKLYDATGQGDLNKIKEFISKTDINIATSSETEPDFQWEDVMVLFLNRPLLKAIQSKNAEIVEMLLEQDADPNLPNVESDRSSFVGEETFDGLGWAIKSKNDYIINLISPKMKSKKESLVAAACNGQNDLVKEILEEDTSAINKSGWINETVYTPLSCALHGGSAYNGQYSPKHKEVIKTLIAYGANVNLPDPSGQDPEYNTPLELAAYTNDLETVKLLIDNGADVNGVFRIIRFYRKHASIEMGYEHSLEIAEKQGNTEIIKLLLDAGADKNKKDEYDQLIDEQEIEGTYSEIAEKLKAAKAKEEKALLEKEHSKYTKNNLPEWWIEDYNRNLHPFSELEEVMKDVEKYWNKN